LYPHVTPNENDEKQKGAILADDMGLGKTIMTISCIYSLFKTASMSKSGGGMASSKTGAKFIVVTPASLVKNWFKEFDKWLGKASQLKRVSVTSANSKEKNSDVIRSFCNNKQSEVLLVSYEQLRLIR